jgi:hypothetical protein
LAVTGCSNGSYGDDPNWKGACLESGTDSQLVLASIASQQAAKAGFSIEMI